MKRVYVFDLDNTIRSSKLGKILPGTKKLIQELSAHKDNVLVLATGRGFSKIDVLEGLDIYFKYKILVNGALVLEDDQIMSEITIHNDDIDQVILDMQKNDIAIGMVGYHEEVVTRYDEHVKMAVGSFHRKYPEVDPNYHLSHHVYQLWVFHPDQSLIDQLVSKYHQFVPFHWHYGGIDLVYPHVSKDQALKEVLKKYPGYQVIAVGDGHNDLGMIKLADIGILLENSRWFDEAEGLYDLRGPHVDSDQLYNFFKENNLLIHEEEDK